MDKMKKNLLVFGYGLTLICGFFFTRAFHKTGWSPKSIIFIILAGIFILLTLFKLDWLKKFYDRWMSAAHVIGMIVTAVILAVMFFIVFGIAGIILRILKKDILDLTINRNVKTYWKPRQKVYNKAGYLQQF